MHFPYFIEIRLLSSSIKLTTFVILYIIRHILTREQRQQRKNRQSRSDQRKLGRDRKKVVPIRRRGLAIATASGEAWLICHMIFLNFIEQYNNFFVWREIGFIMGLSRKLNYNIMKEMVKSSKLSESSKRLTNTSARTYLC